MSTVTSAVTSTSAGPAVGPLLRAWREQRRLSQLALADEAEVSTRHLSCVETGRARASRGFLLHLAEHLDLPLRARNELLVAGGYPPVYGQTDLEAPEMAQVRQALDVLRREASVLGDPGLLALHDELAALPGVQTDAGRPDGAVVLPVRLRTPLGRLSFFTTAARFGTAADVTLAELTIESFFPADAETARRLARP